jgi:hypothetical protein
MSFLCLDAMTDPDLRIDSSVVDIKKEFVVAFVEEGDLPDWCYENTHFYYIQVDVTGIPFCPDCYIDMLYSRKDHEDRIDLIEHSTIISREEAVHYSDLADYFKDNCSFFDFCYEVYGTDLRLVQTLGVIIVARTLGTLKNTLFISLICITV